MSYLYGMRLLIGICFLWTTIQKASITRSFSQAVKHITITMHNLPPAKPSAKSVVQQYHTFQQIPHNLVVGDESALVSKGAKVSGSFIENSHNGHLNSCTPSTRLTASFEALDDAGITIPPDTQGTVGTSHIMTTLNDRIRIHTKQGYPVQTVYLSDFWQTPQPFDPRICYDPFNNRWIFCAGANPGASDSQLLLAVSRTFDPTGTWDIYYIQVDPTATPTSGVWADFPSLGFNKNWIVVQTNMFDVATGYFDYSQVRVFNKAELFSHGAGNFTLFTLNGLGAVQVPAQTYDKTSSLYLVQDWQGDTGNGQGTLRLYTLSGSIGQETLSVSGLVTIDNTWAPGGPNAPQANSSVQIATNDSRILSLCSLNGSLWGVQTVFLPTASPNHTAIQWFQINPLTLSIKQTGRIEDVSGQIFYAFPSIGVNSFNDVLIGYSFFSPSIYASSGYAFRYQNDPLGTVRCPNTLKAGADVYTKDFGSGEVRWGDYSATMPDPNGKDLWTIQESADTGNRWLTWWGKISPR